MLACYNMNDSPLCCAFASSQVLEISSSFRESLSVTVTDHSVGTHGEAP